MEYLSLLNGQIFDKYAANANVVATMVCDSLVRFVHIRTIQHQFVPVWHTAKIRWLKMHPLFPTLQRLYHHSHSTKILLLHQSISWPFQNAINIVWMQLPAVQQGSIDKMIECLSLSISQFLYVTYFFLKFLAQFKFTPPESMISWTFLFLGVSIVLWCITHTFTTIVTTKIKQL